MRKKKPTHKEHKIQAVEHEILLINADSDDGRPVHIEDKLVEIEQRFLRFAENTNDIIIRWTPKDGVVYVNPTIERVTGFKPEEIIGNADFLAGKIHPDDVDGFAEAQKACWKNNEFKDFGQFRFMTKSGKTVWAEAKAIPVRDERGRCVAVEIIARIAEKQKEIEDALRESEELYRTLLQASPEAIAVIDLDGNLIEVSQQALEVYGFENVEELFDNKPIGLIAPEEREKAVKTIQATLKRGFQRNIEFSLLRKDGSRFIGEVNTAAVRDASGKSKAVIITTRDITNRKRAEKALRTSEERFRSIFEKAAAGMVLTSPELRFVQVNPAFCEFLGYDEGELLQLNVADVTHPDDVELSKELVRKERAGEIRRLDTEKRYVRKDGKIVWGHVISTSIRDSEGNPMYSVAMVQDITKSKRVEEALRASEEKYRTLAEKAKDFIFIIDRDMKMQYVNSFGVQGLGLPHEEMIGKPLYSLFPPETANRQIKNLKKVFDSGASLYAENETDFNGRVLWLDTWLVPLKNEEGEVVAVQGISRDITERKRLEQAKINFLGSVSHELRTPLSLILGYSQMLLKENLPPSVKRKLKVIHERGMQELKLVEELITLAKFESGETRYEMANLGVWNFLRNYVQQAKVMVENLVQKRFHTKNFSFTSEISEDLKGVIVHCDEERIRQTLDNLVENAVKYSSRERLEFKLVASLEQNDVLIGFIDRGMGIPAEEQDAIFKPFYQVRAGKHPLSDGMGKGLSIVKEHVEAHRGKIWLESAPERGSSFFFTLPVKEIAEHVDERVIRKILVVDDDRDIAEFIENLLVGEGFEVRVAFNRKDSLTMLDEETPDLVLIDIQLPDGNGIDICKKLKRDPTLSSILIYLISAKSQNELRAIAEEAGADGFVSKPFEIDSFLDTIDNIKK
ncbi:MAG: PAS domain S-box protein [bacterium]